ncbi:MAG: hypothetical protein R3C02_07540 [Planctomycetaceae bacterium]
MRKPFFKKSHQTWYVHHLGKMVRLGPDKKAAFRKYHELMLTDATETSTDDTVASLFNAFLDWCQKNNSERTYEFYRDFLSSFIRSVGTRMRISSLKPIHVIRWYEARNWNETNRYNAVRSIKRPFNWAIRQGRLNVSPLRNLERPTPRRRDAFVTRQQFEIILSQISDECFREYLSFMYETGARPQEMSIIEARYCDLSANRIVIPASQAKGKRHPRVIYFTDDLAPMIERRGREFPTGPLFRNRRGQPWNKMSMNCRMRRLRVRLMERGTPMDGLCATASASAVSRPRSSRTARKKGEMPPFFVPGL